MIKLAALLDSETLRRIAGEAVGEASMCWDPLPGDQVFDSTKASKIVDRLVVALKEKKSAVHQCKECGKAHAPRCDKCGSTRDLRSYHGPCGKCAFGKTAEVIPGGKASGKKPSDFSQKALARGRKVEREHTRDPRLATEIAMDHLTEDPAYYEKLKLIEKHAQELANDVLSNDLSPMETRTSARSPNEKRATMVKYTKKKRKDTLRGEFERDNRSENDAQATRDLPEQITKAAMFDALADEMEKISKSVMRNVGSRIKTTGKGWGNALATAPGRTVGAVGDLLTSPVKTMKQGWHATWKDPKMSGGALGKGMFALGTLASGAAVVPKNDPMQRGESRLTRASRFVGSTALGIAGMKRGILPSIALGIGGDVAGGYVGRAIDRARGRPTIKPTEAA
jgi:predicted RNA-binding Zn-ribbon protein involved in translation (DUF1610 family)